MSKIEIGAGLGVAAVMAVCCAGPLLLLVLAGSGLAILTGQTVLIVAGVLLLGASVVYAWWRRSKQCRTETSAPQMK